MSTTQTTLVSILANIDAVFLPWRRYDYHAARTRWQLQQRYHESGIAWGSGLIVNSNSTTDRKSVERVLDELTTDGLVERSRGATNRTTAIRLTDLGDTTARLLAAMPTLAEATPLLARLTELTPRSWRGWVDEYALAGIDHPQQSDDETLARQQVDVYGLLVRRFVETNATSRGLVHWQILDAGRAYLASPSCAASDATASQRLVKLYDAEFERAKLRINATDPPDQSEIAPIPLPVSKPDA